MLEIPLAAKVVPTLLAGWLIVTTPTAMIKQPEPVKQVQIQDDSMVAGLASKTITIVEKAGHRKEKVDGKIVSVPYSETVTTTVIKDDDDKSPGIISKGWDITKKITVGTCKVTWDIGVGIAKKAYKWAVK